jgi:DHA2 family multidrug resistance protein-like MFS transporter
MAVAAISLPAFLAMLDFSLANTVLPSVARDMHVAPDFAIWATNAYLYASLLAIMPLAALGDRIGFAVVTRAGLALFMVASLGCALAPTMSVFVALRFVQGLAGACIMSVNTGHLRNLYPDASLGRAIAFNSLMISLGVTAGPPLSAALLSLGSWRMVFCLTIPLGFAALLMVFAGISGGARETSKLRFDTGGAVFSAAVLAVLLLTVGRAAHAPLDRWSILLLLATTLGLIVLGRHQARQKEPLVPLDLFAVRDFRRAFLSNLLAFAASAILVVALPFELTRHGLSQLGVGLVLTAWPLAIIGALPLAGILADRGDARVSFVGGLLLIAGGSWLLSRISPASTPLDIAWRVALPAFGFGIFLTPNSRLMVIAAGDRRGGASGMVSLARLLGQSMGASIVIALLRIHPSAAGTICMAATSALGLVAIPVGLPRRAPRLSSHQQSK